jgi:vacuolar-type H+-ATPase subunit C/Vma6
MRILRCQNGWKTSRYGLQTQKKPSPDQFSTYKTYYDQTYTALPEYIPEDFVSIRLDRHPVSIIKRNKLSAQKLPPYEILEVLAGGRALRLKIPANLGIHDVISVQNVDRASDPRDDAFGRHPGQTGQRIITHRDTAKHGRRY